MRIALVVMVAACTGTQYGGPTDATRILIDESDPSSPIHSRLLILGLQATYTHSTTTFDEKSATMALDDGHVQAAIDALAGVDFLATKQPELTCPGAGASYPLDTVTADLTEGSNMLKIRLDCTSGIFTSFASADQRIFKVTGFADWVTTEFP